MSINPDVNWWQFSIDSQNRGSEITSSDEGLRHVNPALPDERHLLTYHEYLGLDKLLSCQVPSSMVPDERCFVITHQLFELVFKLIVFDLTVIAETFKQLLNETSDESFRSLCENSTNNNNFWQPALTASSRIKYSSQEILPAFIGYLANTKNKDETFSSLEFYSFREYLKPASGFQTAQFRLIQRALGKSNLLSIKLYPAKEYWGNYESKDDAGPVGIVDSVILREDAAIASPSTGSPTALTAKLDELAHQVLERLGKFGTPKQKTSDITFISQRDVENSIESFKRLLSGHRNKQEQDGKKELDADEKDRVAIAVFSDSLIAAVEAENDRRRSLKTSHIGAVYLHHDAAYSYLSQVLNNLVSADTALHGKQSDSFLSIHSDLASMRIHDIEEFAEQNNKAKPSSGTGGGGVPYLGFVRTILIPLFPALIAYRDLADVQN